jgi:hypothetical protein
VKEVGRVEPRSSWDLTAFKNSSEKTASSEIFHASDRLKKHDRVTRFQVGENLSLICGDSS